MTDKEEIKFAIRYLKKGLKSKRTPPLYEELMNELGFVKKDKVNNLTNWQKYSKELKEAKVVIKKLYSHVFQGMGFMEINDYNVEKAEAEQFLKECEK